MFRIEYLKLKGHPQLGDVNLQLSDIVEIKKTSKPYTSVIIGPNGTGKSYILRTIADIFNVFSEAKETDKINFNLPYEIDLKYFENENEYRITVEKNQGKRSKNVTIFKNSSNFDFLNRNGDFAGELKKCIIKPIDLELPEKLIVNSVMPTDRFVFKNSEPNDFYQYLGARSTNSTSSTKSSSRKTIKYLFSTSKSNVDFLDNLKELLSFLDFEKSIEIIYLTKINKLFFSGELIVKDFKKYYEEWWDEKFTYSNRSKNNPLWSIPFYNKFLKGKEDEIKKIVDYLNIATKTRLLHKERSKSKNFPINLFDNKISLNEIEIISKLEKLDIINLQGIKIKKNNSILSIEEVSSGEFHLLISLIGMFSKISQNSLVLIDEPEISLHPNWQMKYITFLKKVFSKYPSCQFVLTSHSHFIVSDLEGESSSVTALSRDEETKKLHAKLLKADTYGWSAEEILLKVFKANTSRNYYIAEKLGSFLDYISDKNSTDENIKSKFYELEIDKLSNLSDEDPLKVVYNTIVKEYVFN